MKKRKILVTGGAGYIGSFTVKKLQELGFAVVVLDNLEFGHKKAIDCPLIVGDLGDTNLLEKIFKKERFDAIIHFASYIVVAESSKNPGKYFQNNVLKTKSLFDMAVKHKVLNFIFSSSAAVYGTPQRIPIKENDLTLPNNPYGESKAMVERMLYWYDRAYKLKFIVLRYFNAGGGALDGSLGEDHHPESHLIPRACLAALGKIKDFKITCPRCNTPDKSSIRDYIHVLDLANAHVKALEFLFKKKQSDIFNVGTGKGYSTLSVIKKVGKISGHHFDLKWGKPRPGESEVLVASNGKIKKILGWRPKYSDLDTIVKTAWLWHKNHPQGF
jgi:UDP-glucose 4-epimerase